MTGREIIERRLAATSGEFCFLLEGPRQDLQELALWTGGA